MAAVSLPDGRVLLATGGRHDGTVRLWDPTTGLPVGEPLIGDSSSVSAVAVVPLRGGRTLLACSSFDGSVRLWDPTTGAPVGEPLIGDSSSVSAVAAVSLPDGRVLLATGTYDGTLRLWDLTTSVALDQLALGDAIIGVAVCEDELFIATRNGLTAMRVLR